MYLGIDDNSGLIYEGASAADIPSIPTPSVTQAKLVDRMIDWSSLPAGLTSAPFEWVFREDSFDPVSRVRRGRLYQPNGNTQPQETRVAPHPYDVPAWTSGDPIRRNQKQLHVYAQCSQLLNMPKRGLGAILALGSPLAASFWRIVQTEMLVTRAVMVTLKSLSAYDILPELDESKIEEGSRAPVAKAVERALDAAFRESPTSVIDQCRNAITVALARWMAQRGHDRTILKDDLGVVAEVIGKEPHKLDCASNLGKTIARLHNRGKDNVAFSKGSRPVVEEDAELALQALGLVLRDLGWAREVI
jgi:hypothetical protein